MRGIAALLLLLPLAGCGAEAAPGGPPPYAATAIGRIDSIDEARRLVAEVDGVIGSIAVRRGDRIEPGQVLATIRCRPREEDVMVARASAEEEAAAARRVREGARPEELAAARADADAAAAQARDLDQRRSQAEALVGRGFVSRREAEARRNESAESESRLMAARARFALLADGSRSADIEAAEARARGAADQLRRAQALRDQCRVTSPVRGQVLAVLKREGEASGASEAAPIFVVGDPTGVMVRAEVNERDAAEIRIGQRVEIWADGGPRWRGRVASLAGVMGRRTARSLDPTDRFDRDVREAFVMFDAPAPAVIGMRVNVGFMR